MLIHMIFISLLTIHITSGFTSLFCAFGALSSAKGQTRHRQFGRIFFYAMTVVFFTAIPLALMTKNLFLFLIAIFSYYLAFSGWRFAKNPSGIPAKIDWITSGVMLVASVAMISFGIYNFKSGSFETTVLLVFGIVGGLSSLSDLKIHRNKSAVGKQRIIKHLGNMLGATIAALTAFSVTNIPIEPTIILWFGPTLIFVPVIAWWKYKVLKSSF